MAIREPKYFRKLSLHEKIRIKRFWLKDIFGYSSRNYDEIKKNRVPLAQLYRENKMMASPLFCFKWKIFVASIRPHMGYSSLGQKCSPIRCVTLLRCYSDHIRPPRAQNQCLRRMWSNRRTNWMYRCKPHDRLPYTCCDWRGRMGFSTDPRWLVRWIVSAIIWSQFLAFVMIMNLTLWTTYYLDIHAWIWFGQFIERS